MRKIPRIVRAIKKRSRLFAAAGKVLEVSSYIRTGGPIQRTLGAMVAVKEVIDIFYPADSPWGFFASGGYKELNSPIDGFIAELLMRSNLQRQMVAADLTTQGFLFYFNGEPLVGLIMQGRDYVRGPYLPMGEEETTIKEVLRRVVWDIGPDLMLSAKADSLNTWKASGKFDLNEMAPPGPYLGLRHEPLAFAKRLAKYGKAPRSVLLRGPTGVGKSVFARHVATHSAVSGSNTLKIASSVLEKCSFNEVVYMVKLFMPTVLLLDDLALDDGTKTEGFLSMLEALRDPDCLVIATMMTSGGDDPDKEPEMGDWHFPGIRPGRIDEIETFYLPCEGERNLILRHYLKAGDEPLDNWDEIIKKTEGLSGAYLGEVARRLTIHGFDSWEREITNILRASPKLASTEEAEEGEAPTEGKVPATSNTVETTTCGASKLK